VLYAKPGLDITKEIVDGLNTEYKAAKQGKK
jgi:Skp family chaperone for outer membrane proteins